MELEIFEQGWPGNDTVCGWGSTMENTKTIRTMLPHIIEEFNIESITDAGCGDLFWLRHTDLKDVDYIGYDLYERSTWQELRERGVDLQTADITKDDLRKSDLIICRDVFIHLPNRLVLDALDKFKQTAKFLFLTNFMADEQDQPIDNFDRRNQTGMTHSKLDLRNKPFNLGPPLLIIPENYPYKSTSLWKVK